MDDNELSLYVYEHVICKHYGWALESVRNLDLQDFYVHLRICMAREAAEKEFQAMLAGATPEDEAPAKTSKSVMSQGRQRLPSGAIKETTTEKAVSIRGKLKKVRINKAGDVIGDA